MIPDGIKLDCIARVLANHSEKSKLLHKHACAVVVGGKIKSIGVNTLGKIPKHAEMNAIENYKRIHGSNLNRCYLVVIRLGRNGNITVKALLILRFVYQGTSNQEARL